MEAFATTAEYRDKYDTEMDDGKLFEWLADASDIMMSEMDSAMDEPIMAAISLGASLSTHRTVATT